MIDVTQTQILHGDSFQLVQRLPDRSVDCLVADPPYGVNFWSRSAETAEGKKWVKKIHDDSNLGEAISKFLLLMDLIGPKLKTDADAYIFTRWDIVDAWIKAVRELTPWLTYKMLLIWDKGSPGMGDIDSNWGCGHELILYLKGPVRRDVAYRRSSILHFDRVPPPKAIHPTEKPVPLIDTLIGMSTKPGQVVLDPYSGSGSTAVAAQASGRIGIGFELDDEHYARSIQRLTQRSLF